MREKIEGCHTSARRYCIDRINDLRERGQKVCEIFMETNDMNNHEIQNLLKDSSNSLNILSIRVEIMKVILRKIESIIQENYLSLEQIKNSLVDICMKATIHDNISFAEANGFKSEICCEEKQKFCDFLYALESESLHNVKPLFFRRVLPKDTAKKIKEELCGILNDFHSSREDILCFKEECFLEELDIEVLKDIFKKYGVDKIWEINLGEIVPVSYVIDISGFKPFNEDGFNIYWCSEKMDWAIEQNHEGYYFVYGKWLINEIKNIWNDWEARCVSFS